jgi:bifunctional DNA-binding transcriptional regulator/antitoxin component of YhaV-PrlF toxin-antitoxin module
MSSSVMTRKGQIAIPVEIRRRDEVKIVPVGDVVARTAGIAGIYREGPAPTIKELKEAMERAIAEDVVARMSR